MNTYRISHGSDADGLFAGYFLDLIASSETNGHMPDDIIQIWEEPRTFVPILIDILNTCPEGSHIYIGDLSPSEKAIPELVEAIRRNFSRIGRLLWIDHHASTELLVHSTFGEKLPKVNPESRINPDLSCMEFQYIVGECAAMIAFNYMKYIPSLNLMLSEKFGNRLHVLEHMVNVVNDRDVWKFKLPLTREAQQIYLMCGHSLAYQLLTDWGNDPLQEPFLLSPMLISIAEGSVKKMDFIIDKIQNVYSRIRVEDLTIGWYITDQYTSEIGNMMYDDGCDIGVLISPWKGTIGVRSKKWNCKHLVTPFGGGGHVKSSGATYTSLAFTNELNARSSINFNGTMEEIIQIFVNGISIWNREDFVELTDDELLL